MKIPSLDGYNRVMFAVIGTGVVVMVTIGLVAAAVKVTGSLFGDSRAMPVAAGNGAVGADEPARYDFCLPIQIPESAYQLIRVSSDRLVVHNATFAPKPEKKSYSGVYDYGESSRETCGFRGKDHPTAVVNVLVRNAETGAVHTALAENAVVYTLEYPMERGSDDIDEKPFPPAGTLFWEIATADTSGDGVIDDDDDLGAYLSDADGRNLKRITPVPSRVLAKQYDKARNALLLNILRDTNGDGKLDDKDQDSLVESDVASRAMLREVLNQETLAGYMRQAEPRRQASAEKN